MRQELTMDGLFGYFDPIEVEKIIELPLIQRYLSVSEYNLCKEACAKKPIHLSAVKEKYVAEHAVLNFEALKHASIGEVMQYLNLPNIRDAYLQAYGEYFTFFESNVLFFKDKPDSICGNLFPVLDEVSEKTLIFSLKSAIGLPLEVFNNALLQQDFLLQEIAAEFVEQATKAQDFIFSIQESDTKHKQSVINLAFSFIRLGFGVVNAGELFAISASLSALVTQSFDEMQDKFASIVFGIQNLVTSTHHAVLADAEKGLFLTSSPKDIERCWTKYRVRIFEKANSSIKDILKSCIANDNFFRCIIRETLCQHKNLTYEMLQIKVTEKAEQYFAIIAEGLISQVTRIQHMRDVVISAQGRQKIECYYRKIGLINYAKQHEEAGTMTQKWLTKRLGHRLAFYFPEIFQKKWTPVVLFTMFHHPVNYCKQQITPKDYQDRMSQAAVVLRAVGNSSKVKVDLYMYLEDQIPRLSDDLIHELQKQDAMPEFDVFLADGYNSVRKTRHSFSQSKRVLFDFTDPENDLEERRIEPRVQSEKCAVHPVVLLSHRWLSDS